MFRNLASFDIAIGDMTWATFGVLSQTIIGQINGMATKLIPISLLSLLNTPTVAKPSALDLQLVNNMKEVNKLKDFIHGYKIASLWSSNDNDKTDCEFLDERFSVGDFDKLIEIIVMKHISAPAHHVSIKFICHFIET